MALQAGCRLGIVFVDSEQHEAAVVRKAMGREGSRCERHTAEGFDGVGVELKRVGQISKLTHAVDMENINILE